VPFTGSPAATLTIGRDKMLTKRLLLGSGLPTPAFFVVEQLPCPPCGIDWPVIVKPGRQDGSVGIEQASVVTSQPQLERQVAAVLERYGPPVLVEEFNPNGDEALPTVLPLTEVRFDDDSPSVWPIYSFDAKWAEESREYETTPLICPVPLEPALHARLDRLAVEAFRLLGCRDYGRVDFRMTPEGEFYILEVNPNPFINNLALRDGLEVLGRTPKEFIANLMRRALARGAVRGRAGQGSMSVA
jgi:D-alanine-D-alanine ligase